ncbi:MAG TPA: beta-L-arabinofuranosidase domain-containing protein [Edaphobacter sp.]|jgi:hypothetical protein|nr:beta-L-arabinofuranosidase domain-containing protein [Edaphobacter sp.]
MDQKPSLSRRTFVQGMGAASLILPSFRAALASPSDTKNKLASPVFQLLPLGEVRPTGWLLHQLQIQADGLGGHLDETWPDVGPNSGWLGGTGESWERGPYFLDGLIPLAWLLDDSTLKAKAQKFVEWILANQSPDGMLGPKSNIDWWPRIPMLKALAQYYEVTGDKRVIPAISRYFAYQRAALPGRPLESWGRYRWQDEVYVVEWLYDRNPDPALLELAALLHQQGYDWRAQFEPFRYTEVCTREFLGLSHNGDNNDKALQCHGVNNGQAIKTSPVWYRITNSPADRAAFATQLAALDKYHGLPNGIFSCDEHLAGRDPSHGSELCTVVETMFSLEVALAILGDASIADRIEKLAYNALPGTFSDDMWAHQYDQQPNQIQVSLNSKPWTTNGVESNLYGLEPNFGCCTANFHQGWPKLTSSLWMRSSDDGLVAAIYAPCEVSTHVGDTHVRLTEETGYPFRGLVKITVNPAKPAHFPVSLRIPEWATGAKVRINGQPASVSVQPAAFTRLDREWKPGDIIELDLPMQPRVSRWFKNSVAIERGPLVFSYSPGESWVKLRQRGLSADWQVFPTKPWNYALKIDETSASSISVIESPIGARPFANSEPPVKLQLTGARIDSWRSADGVANPLPQSPLTAHGPEETLTLIPYAAAKLRITAFSQYS